MDVVKFRWTAQRMVRRVIFTSVGVGVVK